MTVKVAEGGRMDLKEIIKSLQKTGARRIEWEFEMNETHYRIVAYKVADTIRIDIKEVV